MADLTNIQPPPTDNALDMLFKETRRRLPDKVVAFFRKYNGAKTDGILVQSSEREVVIERFLAVSEPDQKNGMSQFDICVVTAPHFERFLGSENSEAYDLIPFAVLFAGDMLCLDYRTETEPSVVHWSHEKSENFKPNTAFVATSFSEFLSRVGIG